RAQTILEFHKILRTQEIFSFFLQQACNTPSFGNLKFHNCNKTIPFCNVLFPQWLQKFLLPQSAKEGIKSSQQCEQALRPS
ncbi:MAG TPA: hypothetical protein VN631_08650, partial [Negativicutes bacterium]|nr:hypothetical protein [Negativicutes bacterium]